MKLRKKKYDYYNNFGHKLIVKQLNRRLYDTDSSQYINIDEILKFQLNTFKVIEKTTHEDITTQTLLLAVNNHFSKNSVQNEEVIKNMFLKIQEQNKSC